VILQARELVELYLVESELTIHSAHLHKTSLAHFRRLWARIENDDELLAQVKPSKYGRVPAKTTGQEAIELVDGRRIEFSTRTKSASRGLSCDLLVLDEAMFLPEADHAAAFFTGSARFTTASSSPVCASGRSRATTMTSPTSSGRSKARTPPMSPTTFFATPPRGRRRIPRSGSGSAPSTSRRNGAASGRGSSRSNG